MSTLAARERFRVTYDIVTAESAEHGDVAEAGFAHPGGWKYDADDPGPHELTLKEALSATGRHVSRSYGAGFEDSGSWFSTCDSDENYRTGESTNYSIHPPDGITPSSYARVRRVLCGT